jgi:CheY-like chemotaxis protein
LLSEIAGGKVSAPETLRVLLLEDNPTDVELTKLELERAGYHLIADVVDSPAEFEERIESRVYDIVLADHNLPQWTGMQALLLLKKRDDIPFILVTGSLGEETAVEYIRNGASDYVSRTV